MIPERFKNQTGIIKPEVLATPITIIGAGAIGSFFTTTLAKMGATNLTVYDFDTIEEHNIANQMYPEMMVGTRKTEALSYVVDQYSGVKLRTKNKRWSVKDKLSGIVIVAVDNMEIRNEVWKAVKNNKRVPLLIDGRMGAQVYRVYTIKPNDKKQVAFYQQHLYSDSQAREERCTARSIIYTVLSVTGTMLNGLKKYLNGEKYHQEVIYDAVTDTYLTT